MPIMWREMGGSMGVVDLRKFDGDQIVVHFGGQFASVDAYTFANALISLADLVRAVNEVVNPGQNIEVRLDAVGPGSFRAVIKRIKKGFGGFLSRAPENLFWAIVSAVIIGPLLNDGKTIKIFDDRVEIVDGGDKIIISREAFDHVANTRGNAKIEKAIRKTFDVIEKDEGVTNFGITPRIDDKMPLVQVDRSDFHRLAIGPIPGEEVGRRRAQNNRTEFVVLKPWVDVSKHKWSFEWNGVPISAFVEDRDFLFQVKNHEIRFGNGDAIDARIDYFQDFDDNLSVWVNDTNSFVITEVFGYIPKGGERVRVR